MPALLDCSIGRASDRSILRQVRERGSAGAFGTPTHVTAWNTGADGERRTEALLKPLESEGFRILHDRRIPGARSANIDHIVIGPSGVFAIETKSYDGQLRVRGHDMPDLDHLLSAARAAAPNDRIRYRDPIAAHGGAAIAALVPWFSDKSLAYFAIRTIAAAGRNGARE